MSWSSLLGSEKKQTYFQSIQALVQKERLAHTVYPDTSLVFNAFKVTPWERLAVVILGQDPYHAPNQAHGLSFSVPKGIKPPPSLINIFKELHQSLNIEPPSHGCLEHWAKQGVLLLNTTLTVRHGMAQSHGKIGWSQFTDRVIQLISQHQQHVVFLLWGKHAQQKRGLIDEQKHLCLCAPHPSPLSAHRGFIGCNHFKQTNDWLLMHKRQPIDWRLPS